jgi:Cof subfamily protein (haloacid dehalogenase superfamily)
LTPRPEKYITPRTHLALRQAVEAGLRLVIATGQTLAMMQHVCGELPLHGPQIVENGAVLADLEGHVYATHLFPAQHVLPVLELLRTAGCHRAYHTLQRVYVDRQTPRAHEWYPPPIPPVIEVEDVASLYRLPCLKLVGVSEEAQIRALRAAWEQRFAGQLCVTQTSFDLVEFLHPEVSKGRALQAIATDLGIAPEEIVAFGDHHNDIGMLRFAGLGIAMGNALEEVKAEADYVTASNAEEGVARVIEELILPALKNG